MPRLEHCQVAGAITYACGRVEAVAVKVVETACASGGGRTTERALSVMAMLSRRLAGCVMQLKGWHKAADGKLLIAMELAAGSLGDAASELPDGRMLQQEWVRACVLAPCTPAALTLLAAQTAHVQTYRLRSSRSCTVFESTGCR